jgi:phospholipase C
VNGYGYAEFTPASFNIRLTNTGSQTAVFQVRSGLAGVGPRSYTVQPLVEVLDTWVVADVGALPYDLSVHGPNGFFRAYKGSLANKTHVLGAVTYDVAQYGITLQAQNLGAKSCLLQVANVYNGTKVTRAVAPLHVFTEFFPLHTFFGWYDLVVTVEADPEFREQFAGHLENGLASRTDPRSGS